MECLICGSQNVISRPTMMSDFLVARIFGDNAVSDGIKVNLCHCNDCSFSFYDRRLTGEEEQKLYAAYREEDYQKTRERYDCWYTAKINEALNTDKIALSEQRRVIASIIHNNIEENLETALDYGGNRGDTFSDDFCFKNKYVYDISDVDTVPGVISIPSFDRLKELSFDFIMCNMTLEHVAYPLEFTKNVYDIGSEGTYFYFEVPSENPFESEKFSIKKNIGLLFNPNFNKIKMIKHYLHIRKGPYMPMTEHVNFFTPEAIRRLMELTGFEVIDISENYERSVLGNNLVLSVLCRKQG